MPAKSLADVITFDDIFDLLKAETKKEAQLVIVGCITRLPEPRVYLATPPLRKDSEDAVIWECGRDILSSDLLQQGISTVDAETVRVLGEFSYELRAEVEAANPCIRVLVFWPELFNAVYFADSDGESEEDMFLKILRKSADRKKIITHTWAPEVVSVPRPPNAVTL